jgi:hypothetical protein
MSHRRHQRRSRLRSVLVSLSLATGLLAAAAFGVTGGCGGFATNGITVTGKARIGLKTYAYQALADRPPTKNLHCEPGPTSQGVRITAGVEETDRNAKFDFDITFDPTSLQVTAASATARQDGQDFTGDSCVGQVTDYQQDGTTFAASVNCPTSNGGSDNPIDIETTFNNCHLLAPR